MGRREVPVRANTSRSSKVRRGGVAESAIVTESVAALQVLSRPRPHAHHTPGISTNYLSFPIPRNFLALSGPSTELIQD